MIPRSAITAVIALSLIGYVNADDPAQSQPVARALQPCATSPPSKGRSSELFASTPLLIIADDLEKQGEAAFHLKYEVKTPECLVEAFVIGDTKAAAFYTPFTKGLSTLEYRVKLDRPTGATDVLVIYSGLASLMGEHGLVFHVSEERDGIISWYAMFKDEPTYPAVRELVGKIATGEAKPLLAVRWPPGANEGEVVTFDSKRLKK